MKRLAWITGLVVLAAGGSAWIARAQVQRNQERLWQLRNIGKAFYENPTTQKEAVREFLLALQLAPGWFVAVQRTLEAYLLWMLPPERETL